MFGLDGEVALVAAGHSLLIAIRHMLSNDIDYHDLGADHFRNRVDPAKQASRLVHQLQQLGCQAVLTPRRLRLIFEFGPEDLAWQGLEPWVMATGSKPCSPAR